MSKKKNHGKPRPEETGFHLTIPIKPVPRTEGGFFEFRAGGGQYSFQQYATHCLTSSGSEPSTEQFKANFTTWSIEGSNGIYLYPEGPAFQVLARHFMEGNPPITYFADAAHFTALMLCLHPTVFPPGTPSNGQFASYQITASWQPDGPVDFLLVEQKPIEANGEIFMWKHNYYPQKVSFKIEIFPSPTGRNNIFLGGRLGTVLSESI